MTTQFKRTTDLKRSSGLRLSTPVRSLVERVAESAGLTYSDAIRLLVEEALAARAGRESAIVAKLDALILHVYSIFEGQDFTFPKLEELPGRITRAEEAIVGNLRGQAQALSTIEQAAIVRMERKLEKVLDLLAEQAQAG